MLYGTGQQLDFAAITARFDIPTKDGEAPLLPGQQQLIATTDNGDATGSGVPTEAPPEEPISAA